MKHAHADLNPPGWTMPMPSLSRLPVFLGLLLLAACESATGPAPREGQIAGTWSGERFAGSASATLYRDTLYLGGTSPADGLEDRTVHVAAGVYRGPGEYRLTAGGGGVRYLVGGDGIWASYTIPENAPGLLIIEQAENGTISGRLSFEAAAGSGERPAGSRARFSGRFWSVPLAVQP